MPRFVLFILCVFILFSSSYALSINNSQANLTFAYSGDIDDYVTSDSVLVFNINYSNLSNSQPITDADNGVCSLNFSSVGPVSMTYNGSDSVYKASQSLVAMDYLLNISCGVTTDGTYNLTITDYSFTVYEPYNISVFNQTTQGGPGYIIPRVNASFYANVTNLTGRQNLTALPQIVSGASCTLNVNGSTPSMAQSSSLYVGNYTFANNGTYMYSVSCDVGGTVYNSTNASVFVDEYRTEFVESGFFIKTSLVNSRNSFLFYTNFSFTQLYFAGNVLTSELGTFIYDGNTVSVDQIISGSMNQFSNNYMGVLDYLNYASSKNDILIVSKGNTASNLLSFSGGNYSYVPFSNNISRTDFAQKASLSIFDRNNDGLTDFIHGGGILSGQTLLFTNNGTNFTESNIIGSYQDTIQCYFDANNDDYYDLFFSGESGTINTSIYLNNGSNFTFSQSIDEVVEGSCAVGLFLNDSTPDLIIIGRNSSANTYYIYNDTTFTDVKAQFTLPDFTPLIQSNIIIGDFDNDGASDLVICGTNASNDGNTFFYRNDLAYSGGFIKQDLFNESFQVKDCSLSPADYDGDGDLDLTLSGYEESSKPTVILNNTFSQFVVNQPPNPPLVDVAYNITERELFINWSGATDDLTPTYALTYNLEVSVQNGDILVSAKYPVSSHPVQGYLGNMQYRTNYTLRDVDPANIVVRVQAFDNGYQQSDFGTATYTLPTCVAQSATNFTLSQTDCTINSDVLDNLTITVTNNNTLTIGSSINFGLNTTVHIVNGSLIIGSNSILTTQNTSFIFDDTRNIDIQENVDIQNATLFVNANLTLTNITLTNTTLVVENATVSLFDVSNSTIHAINASVLRYETVDFSFADQFDRVVIGVSITNQTATYSSPLLLLLDTTNASGVTSKIHNFNYTKTAYYLTNDIFTLSLDSKNASINRTPLPYISGFDTATDFEALLVNQSATDYANFSHLSDVQIGLTTYGVIQFLVPLNVTELNFTQYVNISQNSVFVNSTGESRLNQSANITIRNVSYTKEPIIYKDSVECTTCTNISFTSTNVSFITDSFSTFTTTPNAKLTIESSTTLIQEVLTNLTIAYVNRTNESEYISDATCSIETNNSRYGGNATTFVVGIGHQIELNFSTLGDIALNVSCIGSSDFEPLNLTTTLSVLEEGLYFLLDESFTGVKDSSIALFENGSYVYSGRLPNTAFYSSGLTNIPIASASYAIADINNDNYEDLLYIGTSSNEDKLAYRLTITGTEQSVKGGDTFTGGTIITLDYDNDGDVDILACGLDGSTPTTSLYRNNLNGRLGNSVTFTKQSTEIINVSNCAITVADVNNDTYVDFFIQGENPSISAALYLNSGTNFEKSSTQFVNLTRGEAKFVDYDSDGDWDLLMTGENPTGTVHIYVYTNDLSNFTLNTTLSNQLENFSKSTILSAQIANETYPTIILSGFNSSGVGIEIKSYQFNGTLFEETDLVKGVQGFSDGSGVIGDFDNDLNPDLFITGKINTFNNLAQLYKTTASFQGLQNTKPLPPNVTADYQNGKLLLNWSGASDENYSTILTYNVQVGNLKNPNQFVSGVFGSASNPTQNQQGNAFYATSKNYSLPPHCLIVRVQAIDGAYVRSDWSTAVRVNERDETDALRNNNIDEDCDGYDLPPLESTGTTGGGGGSSALISSLIEDSNIVNAPTVTEEPTTDTAPTETPTQTESSSSSKDTSFNTPGKEFEIFTTITYNNARTYIKEEIKNIVRTDKTDIAVRKIIPKEVLESASDITYTGVMNIIQDDPIVDFIIDELAYLESKTISYSLPGTISRSQLQTIETVITSNAELTLEEIKQTEAIQEQKANESLTITTKEEVKNNKTEFTIQLDINQGVDSASDVEVEQYIPKCLIEEITVQILEAAIDPSLLDSVEIKEADPIIVWNLKNVDRQQELKLQLDAFREEDCDDEFKIKVLANSYIRENQEVDENELNLSLLLTVAIIIFFGGLFYLATREPYKHESPHIHRLVKIILHRLHRGEAKDKILSYLHFQDENKEDILEAFKHIDDKVPHKFIYHLFKHGLEILIFLTLLVLNTIDFVGIIPGYIDWVKKVISLILILFILYEVNITKLLFNNSHKGINLSILFAMLLLHLKNLIQFAKQGLEENIGFVYSLYSWIWNNRIIFEVYFFYIGIILLAIIAFIIAKKVEVKEGCLYYLFTRKSKATTPVHVLVRTLKVYFILLLFFFLIFNRVVEWLAISIDATIFVLATLILFFLLFATTLHSDSKKHALFHSFMNTLTHNMIIYVLLGIFTLAFIKPFIHSSILTYFYYTAIGVFAGFFLLIFFKQRKEHFTGLEHVSTAVDSLYEKFLKLFHYPQTILLGISGLFILQNIVEIALYIIPNITGHTSHLYLSGEQVTLLSLLSDVSIVSQHLFTLSLADKIVYGLSYAFSLAGYFLLFFIPIFVWITYFTHRHIHPSKFEFQKTLFTHHHWTQRIGKCILITGIPLIIISLVTKLITIKPILGESTTGVSLLAHEITTGPFVLFCLIGGFAIYILFATLLLNKRRFQSALTYATLWFGIAANILLYVIPNIESLFSYFVELYALFLSATNQTAIVSAFILLFFIFDTLIIFGVGIATMIFFVLPPKIKQGILHTLTKVKYLRRIFFLANDMMFITYYEDAKKSQVGNLLHHVIKYVKLELHQGHHLETILLQLKIHHYPDEFIDQVVAHIAGEEESFIEMMPAQAIMPKNVQVLVKKFQKRKQDSFELLLEEFESDFSEVEIKLAYRYAHNVLKGDITAKSIETDLVKRTHVAHSLIQEMKQQKKSKTAIIQSLTRKGFDPELVLRLYDAKQAPKVRMQKLTALLREIEAIADTHEREADLASVFSHYSAIEIEHALTIVSQKSKRKIVKEELEHLKELITWITKAKERKYTDQKIVEVLSKEGWDTNLVNSVLQTDIHTHSESELDEMIEHQYVMIASKK